MEGKGRRVVTLRDVAQRAGVSTMTASKVMRGAGSISEKTQHNVRQAAHDLGYLPNSLAGSLSSRKSRMVAVIIPSIADVVFSEVLSGVNSVLRPCGFQTFIGESLFDPGIETDLLREMLSFRPAGLLLNGGMMRSLDAQSLLERRNCPVIRLWDSDHAEHDFSAGLSHEEAGRLVAEHLLERNMRRIAYVGAELNRDLCARRRHLALQSALRAKGIDLISMTSESMPRQAETGRVLTGKLVDTHPQIEAIHFLNDAMALGGLSYLHEIGIRVPDRVSVVGFNGTSLASAVRTRLTTVDVPRMEIGSVAARALFQMLSGERVEGRWQAPLRVVQGNTTVMI